MSVFSKENASQFEILDEPIFYYLSQDLSKTIFNKLGLFFPFRIILQPKQTFIIDFFNGNESKDDSKVWIGTFAKWCCQEHINYKKKTPIIICAMVEKAKDWYKYLNLESANFKEFYFIFLETFTRNVCTWGGEIIFKHYSICGIFLKYYYQYIIKELSNYY